MLYNLREVLRVQPECQLEVAVPELTQRMGGMVSFLYCFNSMVLKWGQIVDQTTNAIPTSEEQWKCGASTVGCSDFSREAGNQVFEEKLTTHTR